MAFDSLTEKLTAAFNKLRGKGKLSEADVKEGMREIRLALLEADVSFKVVKELVKRVSDRSVGSEVLESLTPAQQIIKIVNEELIQIMGSSNQKIRMASSPPTILMMVGLQGAGKTTHSAKIAAFYKKQQSKRPLLVACDIYRPAAITQLQVLGEQLQIPVFSMENSKPVEIAVAAVKHAKLHGNDLVILDTAGRLQIDDNLMDELLAMKDAVGPTEILLTVDAMIGQESVNVAQSFHEKLGIDGVVLTKIDGDTRGGAALSVQYITGKPIKFVGVGEKVTDLELFYPDRMASRILGMGDMLSLIEKAQQNIDEKKAKELEKKLRTSRFDYNDFLDQLAQMRKMGGLTDIIGMLPGVNSAALKNVDLDDKQFDGIEAIILSMTKKEREHPEILNPSRKRRIAAGSGRKIEEVNRLIKQFDQMQKMIKQMSGSLGRMKKRGRFKMPFGNL